MWASHTYPALFQAESENQDTENKSSIGCDYKGQYGLLHTCISHSILQSRFAHFEHLVVMQVIKSWLHLRSSKAISTSVSVLEQYKLKTVWSVNVWAWFFSGFSGFLPQLNNMHVQVDWIKCEGEWCICTATQKSKAGKLMDGCLITTQNNLFIIPNLENSGRETSHTVMKSRYLNYSLYVTYKHTIVKRLLQLVIATNSISSQRDQPAAHLIRAVIAGRSCRVLKPSLAENPGEPWRGLPGQWSRHHASWSAAVFLSFAPWHISIYQGHWRAA